MHASIATADTISITLKILASPVTQSPVDALFVTPISTGQGVAHAIEACILISQTSALRVPRYATIALKTNATVVSMDSTGTINRSNA